MLEFLHYGFVQRALVAGSFIAILCSTLGAFLVLRRFSLIGDGLAHATFGSVALALLLGMSPLYVSLPVVLLCSLGILRLTEKARIYGDAAIGIVSSLGIALGIILSSLAGGFNVDLFGYLFGSILSISEAEVLISTALSVLVILAITLSYNELLSITFDEESARTSGVNAGRINTIFVLLTAVTVVLSMKVVGIMLISALLIFPPVTALQVARSFRAVMLIGAACALVSVVTGITASFFLDLPAGGTIVVINFLLFAAAFAGRRIL